MPTVWVFVCLVLAGLLALAFLIGPLMGLVVIREQGVGIVAKRFAGRSLPPGRLIAVNGEAGLQADTLSPGYHLGYWPWMYRVSKVPMVVVPQGEIALVVASDGAAIPPGRILARLGLRPFPERAPVPHERRREGPSARHPHHRHLPHQHGRFRGDHGRERRRSRDDSAAARGLLVGAGQGGSGDDARWRSHH